MPKLHPDARPKKLNTAKDDYESLYDLCAAVISFMGWGGHLQAERVPDSKIVRVVHQGPESIDPNPPVVFFESEETFKAGRISIFTVKSACLEYLRDEELV